MSPRYPIPAGRHRCEHLVKRSRFVCTADLAPSVEAARALITEIRREMPDASHHVYAFVVGGGKSVQRGMSDAGEPSGTAGRPTMAVVEGSGLGDLCVVTSRYFGGIKLGTGGLVKAYTEAAQLVLEGLPTELKISTCRVEARMPYALYEPLLRHFEALEASIEKTDFDAEVRVIARVAEDRVEALDAALTEASSGRVRLIRLQG